MPETERRQSERRAAERRTQVARSVFRFHRELAITIQVALVVLSNWAAFWLRFDGNAPAWADEAFWMFLPWVVGIRALTFIPFRLYQGLWRYTSLFDLQAVAGGVAVSSVGLYLVAQTTVGPDVYPRSIFVVDAVLLALLLGGVRLTRRTLAEFARSGGRKRVLVYGAGDAGQMIVREMKANSDYGRPIGFVDDDPGKKGRRIHGVLVLGTRDDIPAIFKRQRPDEVLIAVAGATPENMRSIVRTLEPYKIPIKTLPRLRDIIDGKVELGQIRSLAVEDLLARAPVGLDVAPVKALIHGRRVMVTGAGGSIGSELCRQIASLHPASLLMVERYENSLHAIRMELEDGGFKAGLHPIVADITDAVRISEVVRTHRPEIIFHAAAHKHVPLMEENPCEAIKNNVRGTRLLAQAAELYGVDRFIMISTDKAVNPTSMMGASKRVAELVIQSQAPGSGTSFAVVRFGNVLGSNGSVVPRFMEQIKHGGPVTITHPDMRRFFMLIPEAVLLVLHAASQAESGAIYVLEMGEQVKLVDMARDLIRLSGLVPDEDIQISYIGLRPGEKLYEELVGPEEQASPSAVEKILCVRSTGRAPHNFLSQVDALESDAAHGDVQGVRARVADLIGSFTEAPVTVASPEPTDFLSRFTSEEMPNADAQPCPQCQTGLARRSRARSLPERVRRELSTRRLFRCTECGWRGWLEPLEFGDQAAIDARPAPDLASIDAASSGQPRSPRRSFSPRNLS